MQSTMEGRWFHACRSIMESFGFSCWDIRYGEREERGEKEVAMWRGGEEEQIPQRLPPEVL